MSEEVNEVKSEEKVGFFKKTWKTIVTGVVCAVAGVGITIGADAAKVQDTITNAQARQVAVAAATYSAEYVAQKVAVINTAESKAQAVKEAIAATTAEAPTIIKGVVTVKEAVEEAAQEIKDATKEVKETKVSEPVVATPVENKTTESTKTVENK